MRVVFFGTPQFAVPTLERLIESRHEVVEVITQPDKPAGRGRKLTPPPVKTLAQERGLEVQQPASVKTPEFQEHLASLAPDVAVVAAYGKILPKAVLETPRHGCLNVHASLLPAFRGAAPIQWAIIRGERKTGVTIMQMDEGMDTGPMVARREVDILEDDDALSLSDMLSLAGAELMLEVLDDLEQKGELYAEQQNESQASYAPLIKREMAEIDWSRPAEEIIFAIRGFLPWPKAYTKVNDTELKITGAEACAPEWVPENAFDERIDPGTIVDVFKGRGFVVRTGDEKGVIIVMRVQPAGKPEMSAYDFYNGGGVTVGTVLGR